MNTAMRNSLPESELAKQSAALDPAREQWSAVETLLATLIDEVRLGNWAYVQSWSEGRIPQPDPIRRPGATARRGKVMTLADAQRIDPRLRGMDAEQAQAWLDRMGRHG